MSSLKCDRWNLEFREGCSATVGAAGGKLILEAVWLFARWPTCHLPARHGRPMGPMGVNGLERGGGRPVYWMQSYIAC